MLSDDKDNCLLWNDMLIRVILTVLSFSFLYLYQSVGFVKKYLYLIIIVLVIVLDLFDSPKYIDESYKEYTKTFKYQIMDKIVDAATYLYIWALFFRDNDIILGIVLYRIVGVVVFMFSRDSRSLIVFFDFFKEYLLYLWILGGKQNNTILAIFVFVKILFEFYFHKTKNSHDYTQDENQGLLYRT